MDYQKATQEELRGKYPFFSQKGCTKPLQEYIDEAYNHVVKAVSKYKTLFGKSQVVNESQIDPSFQYQIWFVMPSFCRNILKDFYENHKGQMTLDDIKTFTATLKSQADEEWNMPFTPIDYTKGEKKKTDFSQEYYDAQKTECSSINSMLQEQEDFKFDE